MAQPDRNVIDALLSLIEQKELLSLRWGYVDGSLSEEDVDDLAQRVVRSSNTDLDPIDLVEWMVENQLLFEFLGLVGPRYRSRFAEGVRLLTRLKQILPGRSWMASPDLVSDYRIDARRRTSPRRDFNIDATVGELQTVRGWNAQSRQIVHEFVGQRRLSGFQIRAAQTILRQADRDTGTVLTAGTGSGKTLAFYLPLMMELSDVTLPGAFWTKAVAVFPRIELLKDQFSQAYGLLAPLGDVLRARGGRPYRLGTFFSATPERAEGSLVSDSGWKREGSGYICPFLLCPSCEGPLRWTDQNIEREIENLECVGGCGIGISQEEVVLTRARARTDPPDIVFTTAETMNQRLSDTRSRQLLGITGDPTRRARFLLLDEIHTYGGTSGAQAALVFRRWRHAIGVQGRVRFVGLSATLEDAPRFFADLTGLRASLVTEVSPREDEFEFQSMEYQLVLRGDPSGRTQLLSTTIQVSFLLTRLLDGPGNSTPSREIFGSRVFAFTDDLDATNRIYDFLRDAEARDIFGNPDGGRIPLAGLRRASQDNRELQMRAGQEWEHLEALGRNLSQRLSIGRTSSQDRGVDSDADIIVATSALEVGFNDPTVGAVIQHKSPYQYSTFVQRKGRAGRIPAMRPWTITVLSDFGRDRSSYQSYDRLFDPIVKPLTLPIRNRYVLRIQAVFAMLDWLADSNPDLSGWWWQPASRPVQPGSPWHKQQQRAVEILTEVLDNPGPLRWNLNDHIKRALRLESDDEVKDILWGAPRSILLEALPTLLRRLETRWETHPLLHREGRQDLLPATFAPHPLPDFLPANLFSDLNLPEVNVVLPPATVNHQERTESMPIAQALSRLAPGRVTRRFAPERGRLNHWIPVPLENREYLLPIEDYAEESQLIARIPVELDGEVVEIPCYRPWTIRMQSARDSEVRPTSNAWHQWRTQILPQGEPIVLSTGHDPLWGDFVESISFHMHGFQSPVTIRRFALEARATVKAPLPSTAEFMVITRYVEPEGDRAAVGLEQEVDAIRFALRLPSPQALTERTANSQYLPAWKTAFFRDLVLEDEELSSICNWFQRDRLQQIMQLCLVEHAVSDQSTLSDAFDAIVGPGLKAELQEITSRILAIELDSDIEEDEETPTETAGRSSAGHTQQRWADLLADDAVTNRLAELAPNLWDPDPEIWGRWLLERVHETFGEALFLAAFQAAPDHMGDDSLLLDLDRGDPAHDLQGGVEIWLSESALGGSGAVEALARAATEDPALMMRGLAAAVAPSEVELTARGLEELITLMVEDRQIVDTVAEVRSLTSHERRNEALDGLFRMLVTHGMVVDQALRVAANHRLLREGTGPASDVLIRDLVRQWRQWERDLGIVIDVRTFSTISASHPVFGPRIRELVDSNTPGNVSANDAIGVISGILWPRTGEVLGHAFQSYRQYRNQGHTDPSLIRELLLRDRAEPVKYGSDGWFETFSQELASAGIAKITSANEDEGPFREAIFAILANPIDVDYLQFYPVISDVDYADGLTVSFVFDGGF